MGFDFSLLSRSSSPADVDDARVEDLVPVSPVDDQYPPPFVPSIDPIDEDNPTPITSLVVTEKHRTRNGGKMFKRRQRGAEERQKEMHRRSQPQAVNMDSGDLDHQISSYRGIPLRAGAASAFPALIGDGAERLARLRSLGYLYVPSPV
jgi:hypothetical protein